MAPRLMVIDDDALSLGLISMLLEREGFAVLKAPSGEDALRTLKALDRTDRPDALLVDLQMPRLSGAELAAALRRLMGDKVPLLAMSATGQRTPRGFDGFLLKPLNVGELKVILAEGRAQRTPENAHAIEERCPAVDERTYAKLLAVMPETALREVYVACLHDTRLRLENMRTCDVLAVRTAAHAIKGSAGMLGAVQLARLAGKLEAGAYQSDELSPLLDELLAACEAVERILFRP